MLYSPSFSISDYFSVSLPQFPRDSEIIILTPFLMVESIPVGILVSCDSPSLCLRHQRGCNLLIVNNINHKSTVIDISMIH